jgi:hypothetical protein
MSRQIALISEHASPLGILGGVDSGGQNVYVGQLVAEADRLIAECPQDEGDLTRLYNADPAKITIRSCPFTAGGAGGNRSAPCALALSQDS